ncbi:MAG: hypothetical protein HFH82_13630 [Lachnospiraceae bacterium]|nr:hypothetical protein [Lachnospiraceae bacterium]
MSLFRKNHGAISVFLIIILVPCMLVSSIFVDISRVQLSKTVAESSAELALNTLKTYYDYDLSQYYGLMGSCQNISEYYGVVSEYYDQALHSRDVDEDELLLLYQRVLKGVGGRFQDEKISDLLLVSNESEGAVVSAVSNANMHNSTILQKQIVDFMKYRGPLVLVEGVIETLKSQEEQGGVQASKESEANKPLLDAQEKYYEAESKLLEEANKSYWALRDYTAEMEKDKINAGTLQGYAGTVSSYRDTYREIHGWMVKNLYNTTGLSVYQRPELALNENKYAKESQEISYVPTPEPAATPESSEEEAPAAEATSAPETKYHVTAENVKKFTNELETAITNFEKFLKEIGETGKSLAAPGSGEGQSYEIQWWVQMNSKICTATFIAKAAKTRGALTDAYAKVCAMLACDVLDVEDEAACRQNASGLKKDAEDLAERYKTVSVTSTDWYIKTVSLLEEVSNRNINSIQCKNLSVKVDGTSMSIPTALTTMSSNLTAMKNTADKYVGYLDDIIDGNSEKDIPSLDSLKRLIDTYGGKLDQWESKAGSTETEDGTKTAMSGEHQSIIQKIRNGSGGVEADFKSEGIVGEIKKEDLEELKARLENIRAQFQAISASIDAVTYGGIKAADIDTYDDLKGAASRDVKAEDIPCKNKELNEYVRTAFGSLFTPSTGDMVGWGGLSELYSPVLNYRNQSNDNVPEIYIMFYKHFGEKKPSDVNGQKQALKGKTKESENKETDIKSKGRYHGPEGRDLTESTEKAENAFGFLGGIVGTVTNLADLLIHPQSSLMELRDKLYVTEYMMEMFSYAAFENENYYDLVRNSGKLGELSLKQEGGQKKYEKEYAGYKGDAKTQGTWLSENPRDGYNKSLTNEMINSSNNYAYQAEVEYILFGANNETSVKETYQVIYGIRYLLNLVSGFANFWGMRNDTGKAINGVAEAIAGATGFIVPAPLVKIALIPMLTIFETGKDMDRLEAGFPVELYKSSDDWWISLEGEMGLDGFFQALSGDNDKRIEGEDGKGISGLRYSDYLTLFVFLGLNSSNEETVDGMYQRMADVIERNMQLRTGKNDYSLKNTQVYFQLKSKLRVAPLMLTLPYFSDYVETPSMGDDWCTFEVNTIRGY